MIKSLGKAGEVIVLQANESAPNGCADGFVTEEITVYIKVVGLIDFKAELKRLDKGKMQLEQRQAKLEQKMAGADYLTKVPEKVQEDDKVRLAGQKTEIEALNRSIANISKWL